MSITKNGIALEEDDVSLEPYLTEGCCPWRHGPLERIGVTAARCNTCGLRWASTRIPLIFPSRGFKNKETAE